MVTRPVGRKREAAADSGRSPSDYVVPVVHVHLPEPVVKAGFYGGLATAVAVGALDWPLVLLAGVGVAMARHRRA
ncbi:MAG: hypothetical protein ACLP36_11615 [Acidimicrobiales bacterium]|jgi:hypothetical protein